MYIYIYNVKQCWRIYVETYSKYMCQIQTSWHQIWSVAISRKYSRYIRCPHRSKVDTKRCRIIPSVHLPLRMNICKKILGHPCGHPLHTRMIVCKAPHVFLCIICTRSQKLTTSLITSLQPFLAAFRRTFPPARLMSCPRIDRSQGSVDA